MPLTVLRQVIPAPGALGGLRDARPDLPAPVAAVGAQRATVAQALGQPVDAALQRRLERVLGANRGAVLPATHDTRQQQRAA